MSRSAIPPLSLPSYANGFARFAGESVRPGLWRGLRGLWCPFLGPTATSWALEALQDHSGHKSHAGISASSDYAIVGGVHCINLNTTNPGNGNSLEEIRIPDQDHLDGYTTGLTMLAYVRNHKAEISGTGSEAIIRKQLSYYLRWTDDLNIRAAVYTSGGVEVSYINGLDPAQGRPADEWHVLIATYDLATIRVYVDGIMGGSGAQTGTVASTSNRLELGSSSADGWDGYMALAGIWDRPLRHDEIQLFNADPFVILRRRRRVFKAPAAVGGLSIPVAMRSYRNRRVA